ncbi:MAG: hypothetical protein ACTSR8_07475 [Promethearchaeota archaeon]
MSVFAERNQKNAIYLKLSIRLVQKLANLQRHKDVIKKISNLLDKYYNSPLLDSYSKALLLKQLGESYLQIGKQQKGFEKLLSAYNIYNKFKSPISEEIQVIESIIHYYAEIRHAKQIKYYSEKLKEVKDKLITLVVPKPNKIYPLGEVKEIWLFSKSIGILYYSYSPESDVDDDLLGGFITALNNLSQEVADKTIETMVFGNDRFSIYQEPNKDIYILGRSNIKSSEKVVIKILSIIYNRFWKEYREEIINFTGNITKFQNFIKIIESFDWSLIS